MLNHSPTNQAHDQIPVLTEVLTPSPFVPGFNSNLPAEETNPTQSSAPVDWNNLQTQITQHVQAAIARHLEEHLALNINKALVASMPTITQTITQQITQQLKISLQEQTSSLIEEAMAQKIAHLQSE